MLQLKVSNREVELLYETTDHVELGSFAEAYKEVNLTLSEFTPPTTWGCTSMFLC